MPADVQIRFRAQSKEAQRDINQLQQEFQQLRQQLRGTQQSSEAAENVMQQLGQRSRQVTREVLDLRSTTQQLNRTNAELRQGLVTADAAERKRIQSFISANNVSKALIQTDIQRAGIQKQSISLLEREAREAARLGQSFDGATRGSGLFRETLSSLGGTLGALGIDSAIFQITRFATESARASIEIDSNTRALAVLTGSAAEAERSIREIQELADEPGLRFRQAVAGTVALRAIGTEAETTTRILKELANAAAFSGGEGEFERGLLGFRQLIQRGRLSQEELNQLTENIGLASRVIKEEFGTVLAEDIQAQLNATGMSIDDFVERVLTGFERLERFPLDAPSVKLKNLGNSFFEFQAAVGDKFLPTLASGAEGLTRFFDGFTNYLNQVNSSAEATEQFNSALTDLNSQLANTQPLETQNQAIENYISLVENQIEVLERFALLRGETRGRQTFALRGVDATTLIREEDVAAILELQGELENLQGVLTGSALAIDHFQGQADDLSASIQVQQREISRLTQEHRELAISGDTSSTGYRNLNDDIIQANQVLQALRSEFNRYNSIVGIAEQNAEKLSLSTQLLTANQKAAAAATDAQRKVFKIEGEQLDRLSRMYEEFRKGTADGTSAIGSQSIAVLSLAKHIANLSQDALNPLGTELDFLSRNYMTMRDSVSEGTGAILAQINAVTALGAEIARLSREALTPSGSPLDALSLNFRRRQTPGTQGTDAVGSLFSGVLATGTQLNQNRITELQEDAREFGEETDETIRKINELEVAAVTSDSQVLGISDHLAELDATTLDNLIGEFSQLDGIVGELGTKIGQFDIQGLASGNPASIATLPFQLYDAFTFDQRQADAALPQLHDENFQRFLRGEFGIPTDVLQVSRGQVGRARAAVGETNRFSADQQLALDSLLGGLDPVIGRTSLLDIDELPNRIVQTITEFSENILVQLEETLSQASFNVDFAKASGGDTDGALQDYISAQTAFIEQQIDTANLIRRATGDLDFGNVEELHRQLNALNNQARLQLSGLERGGVFARQRDARALAERTGTDRQAIEDVARAQYGDVAYDAEVAAATAEALEDVQSSPEVTEQVQRAIEALETRTANRLAQSALDAISEAASDVNVTETTLVERWNEAVPQIEAWWQELYDDIINNPDLTEAERTEDLAALGSQQDFVASLKSQYVTPVLMGIAQATEALQTRTANRLAQDAISAMSEAAGDVNTTEQEILRRWTEAIPALENWWQELYEDILNDPNLSDAAEAESLAALGTQQDFVANLKSQYVTPAITGIRRSAEALQTRTANRLAQEALGSLREATSDVNITETEITQLWTAALPALENWYQELLEDANAIESDAERTEAIAALGSPEQFIASLESQYVTPILTGIQRSREALETRTANRLANNALSGLREAASDANITEQAILHLWTDSVSLIENWYQELFEDATAIENDAERAEAIAALGSPEAFIANLRSQYVLPVLMSIQRRQEAQAQTATRLAQAAESARTAARVAQEALQTRTATRVAQEALGGIREATADANVTEAEILNLWTAAIPALETWYQELLDDANAIENDAERAEAIAALGRPDQFVANLRSQYVTPILTGIQRSREALETRTANRLANDALNGLREVSADVNITEAEIVALWENATPFISTWYQELLEDATAIENDAERAEAIAALGTPEQFVANLRSQYVTPVLMGIAQSTEALQTRTANREAQAVIRALGTVAEDVNVTEQAIIDKWEEAVPFIRTWWQELSDDIVNNGILDDAEIAESLAELGSVESFVGNIRSQSVTPVLNNILQTRSVNRSNRAQTGVNRARFNFGGATSESDFERRRELLIEAINTYHDAEEERINSLKVSEEELEHLRSTNSLQRDQALRAATQATNTFEAARRRAAESTAAERLRAEERLQDEIQDLRDKSLDAERERAEALVDLEEETQDRILDIQRKANQKREDINREVARDFTDNFRESQEAIAALLSEEGIGAGDIRSFLSGFEGHVRSRLSESGRSELRDIQSERIGSESDLRRERDRDIEDVGIREERDLEDLDRRHQETLIATNQRLVEEQTALSASIATLTTELGNLNAAEQPLTQTTASETANLESQTAAMNASTAETAMTAAAGLNEAAAKLLEADIDRVFASIDELVVSTSGIVDAIEGLPSSLEDSFSEIFAELSETIIEITQIETGIRQGATEAFLSEHPELFSIPQVPLAAAAPSPVSETSETLAQRVAETVNISAGTVNVSGSISGIQEAARPGIVPIRVPVGEAADHRLFHFAETDAIANRIARQAALSRSRRAPSYLPDATQLRNARDVGREVVAGFTEGLAQRSRNDGGFGNASQQASFPEEFTATVVVQFPDGTVQEIRDQIVRLEAQDR